MDLVAGSNGRRVQRRAVRRDGWTEAKRATFLDMLSATCNIRRAAEAAGMTDGTARALKRRDAGFAQQWEEALTTGYERLEYALLAKALGTGEGTGGEPAAPVADADATPVMEGQFDADLALKVIAMRHAAEGSRRRPRKTSARASQAEIERVLARKLEAIERRLGIGELGIAEPGVAKSETGEPA